MILASFLIAIGGSLIAILPICYANEGQENPFTKNDLGEKAFCLSIKNCLLSLNAKEADVRKLLEEISEKTGVEIEIGANVQGAISISFHDLTLEEALRKIAVNRGIVFSKEKGQNEYQISKVSIFPSSMKWDKIQTKSSATGHESSTHLSRKPLAQTSLTMKASSHKRPTTVVTITNEKTGVTSRVVSNELIVRFKEGLTKEDIEALIAKTGSTVKTHIQALNYYVLSLPSQLLVDEALAWFWQQGVVEQAEPNYLIPIKAIPNDPEYSRQWALHNTGQTGGANDADIDALEAWDIEQGKPEVVIAIIDTGVDYTHEDLAANIWQNTGEMPDNGVDDENNGYIDDVMGWDFVDSFGGAAGEDFKTPDNDPMDRHGHGTHVAGIAGAVSNNEVGIAGVAWNCKIMPVRAGYKTPSGDGILESDDAAQAIIYAAENGAKVINLSWGDYQKSNLLEDAIAYAIGNGALICAAAGNENSNSLIYPAASDNNAVLAVGATDSNDRKAPFSNYGNWVHVSAPGVSIYSDYLNHSYLQMSGTSMSTPYVSGLAALLFSYSLDLSPLEVKTRIMRAVDVLPDLGGKNITSGRINVYSALVEKSLTPRIFSLSLNVGHEGDQITLFGDRFGSEPGSGYVSFNPDIQGEIISWNNSTITCTVPKGAQTGEIAVITSEGTSNGIEITILTKSCEETLTENEFLKVQSEWFSVAKASGKTKIETSGSDALTTNGDAVDWKMRRSKSQVVEYRVRVTLEDEAQVQMAQQAGLSDVKLGKHVYDISPAIMLRLRSLGINTTIAGGVTEFSVIYDSEEEQTSNGKAGSSAFPLDTGTIELSSGTINIYIEDNTGSGQGYRLCNQAAPAGSEVTLLEYRTRIDDEGNGNFYCRDYELWLFSGDVEWETCVYDNLGGATDGGYDDDTEDDYDIYLNWRSTHSFDGEDPNQWWGIICYDNLSGDDGQMNYIEFKVHWEAADYCDLEIPLLVHTEDVCYQGGSLGLSADVKNAGSASCSNVEIQYYLSTNSTISTSDCHVGSKWVTLSPGATSVYTLTVDPSTIACLSPGNWYWGVIIPSENEVWGTANLDIIDCGSSEPDIRVEPTSLTFTQETAASTGAGNLGSEMKIISNAKSSVEQFGGGESVKQPEPSPGKEEEELSRLNPAIQMLFQHPKISFPKDVLKDFIDGKPKTRVIVNLHKPSIAVQLQNLKDLGIRQQLEKAVKEVQDRIIPILNAKDVRITSRFTYIFGFSAEVSLQGLQDLVDNANVLLIKKDEILHAHLAQGIPLMKASTARSTYNGSGMAIAICDTGIDYTHPRLGNGGFPNSKVIGGYDTGQDDDDPMDGNGHGTGCAGIAAGDLGITGDYIGGVAHNAKLYALKMTYTADGDSAYNSDIVEAWDWCVKHQNDDPDNPIMIISTSFGGGRYYSQASCDAHDSDMATAAANAKAAGITLFVSSGNDGYCDSTGWPGCLSDVIGIGAVYDTSFGMYYPCVKEASCASKTYIPSGCPNSVNIFSYYYASDNTDADMVTSYSNAASFLGLLAPSNQTYTTDISGSYGYSSGDYYSSFGGTSAACPYAAGAGACLQSAAKALTGSFLTPSQVQSKLIGTGDQITDGKIDITKPRVNLDAAIGSFSDSFTIYNDGDADLEIMSMTKRDGDNWLDWDPTAPLTISPGGSKIIAITVDWDSANIGSNEDRIIIESNDPDESIYPDAVYITACKVPSMPSSITYPSSDCDGSFTVSWSSVSGATSYTLQRATDSSFSDAATVYIESSTSYDQIGLGNGTYYYRVRASNSCGDSGWRAGGAIVVSSAPVADFTASPTSGCVPLTVNFTDQSTGSPTSWSWDFGDGETSTEQNPSHTYSSVATYKVTLSASNACGSDSESKAGYIMVNPAASYFKVNGSDTITSGESQTITITAYDTDGNVATCYSGDKAVTFSGANPSPNPETSPTCSDKGGADIDFGTATTVNLSSGIATATMKLYKAEDAYIKATEGSITTSDTDDLDVTVSGAAKSKLLWVDQPSSPVDAGTVWDAFSIKITDQYGNRTSDIDTVTVSPSAGSFGGDVDKAAVAGLATFDDITYNTAIDITVTGSSGDLTVTLASTSVTVNPVEASHLTVTGTGTMAAGTENELTITAYDQYGNVAEGYEGTKSVTFTGPLSAPDGTEPTVEGTAVGSALSVTFANGVSDSDAATLIAYRAESTTVDVSDGSINSFGDESYDLDLTVTPATANNLHFDQQPTNTTAGATFTPAVTVEVRDQWNNIRTSDNSTGVTIAINNNPGSGTLSGTTLRISSSGIATFDDLSIDKAGAGYTLEVTSNALNSDISDAFDISPAAISKIVFITPAQTVSAGEASEVITIQTQDNYNNPASVTSNTTINVSSTSANSKFSLSVDPWEDVTFVTISKDTNSADFYYKDSIAGTPTITAAESPDRDWADATQEEIIEAAADLKITKNDSSDPAPAGGYLTYRVTVTNKGPSDAANVILTDNVPSQVQSPEYSTDSGDSWNGWTGSLELGTIGAEVSKQVLIRGTMDPSFTGTIFNEASVSSDTNDPDTGNNSAVEDTIVSFGADVKIQESVDNITPEVGDQVVLTVMLTNNGPNDTTAIQVTDILPSGLSHVSDDSGGSYNPDTGIWNVGNLPASPPNNTTILTITATVKQAGEILNIASITNSGETDPDSSNNSSGVTLNGGSQADLAIEKTVDNASPNAGDTIIFTIRVTNNGLDNASGIEAKDILPTGLTYQSYLSTQGNYDPGIGMWDISALNLGESATLQATAIVNNTDEIINTARITHSDQIDPDKTNNDSSKVINQDMGGHPSIVDLAVQKTVNQSEVDLEGDSVFTLIVRNNGPDDANSIEVNDILPDGLSFVSSEASQGIYDETGVWDIGAIAASSYALMDIVAEVIETDPQTNIANISNVDEFDLDDDNNSDEATVKGYGADISVSKTADKDEPRVGDNIEFTINVKNEATKDATEIQVTDQLPSGLKYQSHTPSQGTYDSDTGVWDIGDLANEVSVTLKIAAIIEQCGDITNTAKMTASSPVDLNPNNDIGHVTLSIPSDGDDDGIPDEWEVTYGLDPWVDDSLQDPDGDYLVNFAEYQNRTDPNSADTDGDGMPDGWEVSYGLNPLVDDALDDLDEDGYSNLEEYNARTNPNEFTHTLRPDKPILSSPNDEASEISLMPELTTEAFSDPDSYDTHALTEWQISKNNEFSSLVLDITSNTHLTSLRVPHLALDENTTYYWRVCFYDNHLAISEWSDANSFTTEFIGEDQDFDGIPDNQEVDNQVDLDGNGIPDTDQNDIKDVKTIVGDGIIGLSIKDSVAVRSIEWIQSIDPDSISDTGVRPEKMPLGLISFRLELYNPGNEVEVSVYLSEPASSDAKWYKYDSVNAWQDYSEHAVFSTDGKSVTLKLKDGGFGDVDGTANGIVVDPSGCGSGNQTPKAKFTASPTWGYVPMNVSFNASDSYDPDGTIESYYWDFGDGSTGSGESTSHSYTSVGSYTVKLTVTDNDGATETDVATVTVVEEKEDDIGICFIATAAYGSPMEKHVKALSAFRDRFLLTNSPGRAFVRFYNNHSQALAGFIGSHDYLRAMVRWSLLPVVGMSWMALHMGPWVTMAAGILMVFVMFVGVGIILRRRRLRHRT